MRAPHQRDVDSFEAVPDLTLVLRRWWNKLCGDILSFTRTPGYVLGRFTGVENRGTGC
jgi:hypothetical protein